MTVEERNQLIVDHIEFANRLAYRKSKKVPFRVQVDELISAAYMGLVDAATKYDKTKNPNFAAYAYPRIDGEILDYLRKLSWGKRGENFEPSSLSSLSDSLFVGKTEPSRRLKCLDFFELVTKGMNKVAKRAVIGYYVDDKDMKEIAKEVKVTRSRISQILTQARELIESKWSESELYRMAS